MPPTGTGQGGHKREEKDVKMIIIATLMIFLAYFLVLYGGVGFEQDKRFFASAPKENLDAIPDKKERGFAAHMSLAGP